MAEAVLAREQIEKFSLKKTRAGLAPLDAPFARLAKNLLENDRPRNAGDGNREHEQSNNLMPEGIHV
jgi:hypothetical protein